MTLWIDTGGLECLFKQKSTQHYLADFIPRLKIISCPLSMSVQVIGPSETRTDDDGQRQS